MSVEQSTVLMAPNGRVLIPAAMRAHLGWQSGARLVARLVDGTVVLEPIDAAIGRAQALVRSFVGPDSGLVEELIAERRLAARDE
jgi:antitoxin PrlF